MILSGKCTAGRCLGSHNFQKPQLVKLWPNFFFNFYKYECFHVDAISGICDVSL